MKERSLLAGVQSPDMRSVAAKRGADPLLDEPPHPEAAPCFLCAVPTKWPCLCDQKWHDEECVAGELCSTSNSCTGSRGQQYPAGQEEEKEEQKEEVSSGWPSCIYTYSQMFCFC